MSRVKAMEVMDEKKMYDVTIEGPASRPQSIASSALVVGSSDLYENGQMRLIPAPTPDPHGMKREHGRMKRKLTVRYRPTQLT